MTVGAPGRSLQGRISLRGPQVARDAAIVVSVIVSQISGLQHAKLFCQFPRISDALWWILTSSWGAFLKVASAAILDGLFRRFKLRSREHLRPLGIESLEKRLSGRRRWLLRVVTFDAIRKLHAVEGMLQIGIVLGVIKGSLGLKLGILVVRVSVVADVPGQDYGLVRLRRVW